MKVKTKKVYYCNFCNKHSLKTLVKHENHCTGNINRECRVCKSTSIWDIPKMIKEFKKRYIIDEHEGYEAIRWVDKPITKDEILDLVEQCPACTLTIIRQLSPSSGMIDFNFKIEMDVWWKDHNEEQETEYF